jgi:hypothetical protein
LNVSSWNADDGLRVALGCGPESYEIPIETPIQPKLDVTPLQRVLVVGLPNFLSALSSQEDPRHPRPPEVTSTARST